MTRSTSLSLPLGPNQQREAVLDSEVAQQDWNSKFLALVWDGFVIRGEDSGAERGPFGRSVARYRQNGWLGTLPLPERAKKSPPTGYTGRTAEYPSDDDVALWNAMPKYRRGNICLHLGPVDNNRDSESLEIIGLDVDDYTDSGKVKSGGQQLSELEAELGPLPATWLSTARADGPSGIRFFLVPPGLAWAGKAAAHIDIIQKCHRYAIVWPSFHPDLNTTYKWYRQTATGHECSGIPRVQDLPRLPEKWVDRLTRGGQIDSGGNIDSDSTVDEIVVWARTNLPGYDDAPCDRMAAAVTYWKRQVDDDASTHDKVRDGHWELMCLASEGHPGLKAAQTAVNNHIATDTIKEVLAVYFQVPDTHALLWPKVDLEMLQERLSGDQSLRQVHRRQSGFAGLVLSVDLDDAPRPNQPIHEMPDVGFWVGYLVVEVPFVFWRLPALHCQATSCQLVGLVSQIGTIGLRLQRANLVVTILRCPGIPDLRQHHPGEVRKFIVAGCVAPTHPLH
ncbi:bifunctional DNA primase/polymerase [Mycobacterium syngnathidarum]